jgi:hypothetical protein
MLRVLTISRSGERSPSPQRLLSSASASAVCSATYGGAEALEPMASLVCQRKECQADATSSRACPRRCPCAPSPSRESACTGHALGHRRQRNQLPVADFLVFEFNRLSPAGPRRIDEDKLPCEVVDSPDHNPVVVGRMRQPEGVPQFMQARASLRRGVRPIRIAADRIGGKPLDVGHSRVPTRSLNIGDRVRPSVDRRPAEAGQISSAEGKMGTIPLCGRIE